MLRTAVLLFLLWKPAFAQHEIYLKGPNNIPLYAQQTNVWCGAATAQMMLEGFPSDENHVHPQKTIWNKIQTLKVESWYTDPDGLERVLAHYGTGTKWRAHCVKDSKAMMRFMVAGMTNNRFPVGAVVYGDGHWISVIGATTTLHPLSLGGAELEKIEAHDPWKAQHVLVSGITWYSKYWYKPVGSGKWGGCYVVVHENSEPQLTLSAEVLPQKEKHVRHSYSRDLKQAAIQQVGDIALERNDFFFLSTLDPQEPMLVNHERGDYYLLPLGDRESGLSYGAVMMNAMTGAWEGLSKFDEPHRYLDPVKALRAAGIESPAEAEWVFSPSEESRSPFHPALKVVLEDRKATQYFSQDGGSSVSLTPLHGRFN